MQYSYTFWLIFFEWRREGANHYFLFLQINWEVYKKTLRRTLFNSLVTSLFFQLSIYPFVHWRGIDCGYELPSFPTVLWHLFLYLVIVEIGFYYTHRYELINLRDSSMSNIMMLLCFTVCHARSNFICCSLVSRPLPDFI